MDFPQLLFSLETDEVYEREHIIFSEAPSLT